jgi:hypothetical protein
MHGWGNNSFGQSLNLNNRQVDAIEAVAKISLLVVEEPTINRSAASGK